MGCCMAAQGKGQAKVNRAAARSAGCLLVGGQTIEMSEGSTGCDNHREEEHDDVFSGCWRSRSREQPQFCLDLEVSWDAEEEDKLAADTVAKKEKVMLLEDRRYRRQTGGQRDTPFPHRAAGHGRRGRPPSLTQARSSRCLRCTSTTCGVRSSPMHCICILLLLYIHRTCRLIPSLLPMTMVLQAPPMQRQQASYSLPVYSDADYGEKEIRLRIYQSEMGRRRTYLGTLCQFHALITADQLTTTILALPTFLALRWWIDPYVTVCRWLELLLGRLQADP